MVEVAEPIVECIDVKKIYRIGQVKVNALRGITLTVNKGEFVSIMGPSGCGKTTLLNIIGSLDTPTEGKVILDGIDISKASEDKLTEIRRDKVGFVFQFYNLLPILTALENVELPMLIAGVPKRKRIERARHLLELVGLGAREQHRPDELSGGERQRVAIARALANNPAILLADEPTGDLDTETGQEILRLMKELNRSEQQTIIMVTHDPNVAAVTDKVYHIRDGKVERITEDPGATPLV